MSSATPASERIAIVGIGAVLPGAYDLAGFWQMVLAARSAARQAPAGRWAISFDDALASGVAADRAYSPFGCFLDDAQTDIAHLAGLPLGIDLELVARLDPLYRLLIRAGYAAWSNAVTKSLDRRRVGVIVGNIALPTQGSSRFAEELLVPLVADRLGVGSYDATGGRVVHPLNRYVVGLPAGLLAAALGLQGGAFALDAACASSLYALKLAADELLAHRADAMLAGGVSRPDCLYTQMGFSQLHALSPSGRCAPFDARADGLVVGEGAGVFLLKRLSDAVAHGDRIHAVIAGCGLSNDIGGNLMSPDSRGQLRAMRAAYRVAGCGPGDVDLVECHGTGTPIGDATEFRSLATLWRDVAGDGRCVIGSVKSNVGHLLTGAGGAGLVKTLLALGESVLPPSANFETPGREIDLDASRLRVLKEPETWPQRRDGAVRRAAVSGFGFGGINAHVVLEEWREPARGRATASVRLPEAIAENNETAAIAIVGMAAHVGPWRDLDAVATRLFRDEESTPTMPDGWWGHGAAEDYRGYFIESLDVPLAAYRIPPAELADMLPQQLLMMEVARAAMLDAGLTDGDSSTTDRASIGSQTGLIDDAERGRIDMGVFVGIGLDLNTTNFHVRWSIANHARRWAAMLNLPQAGPEFDMWLARLRDAVSPPLSANRTMGALGGIVASRVARWLRAGGPSFVISSEETSGLDAIATAMRALERGEIRVALAGAVDLAGDIRAVLGQHATRPFVTQHSDDAAKGPLVGEGAAALILKRLDDAVADGDRVYAVIRAATATSATNADLPDAALPSIRWPASIEPSSVGLIAAHQSGRRAEDNVEWEAIAQIRKPAPDIPACAVTSAISRLGDTGAASGVLSLVAAALSLSRRQLPLADECAERKAEGEKPCGALFSPRRPQHWLHDRDSGPRRAAAIASSIAGTSVCVVLEESPASVGYVEMPSQSTQCDDLLSRDHLFLARGATPRAVVAALDELTAWASDAVVSTGCVARRWWNWNSNAQAGAAGQCVSIVARSRDELIRLASLAAAAVRGGKTVRQERVNYSPAPIAARHPNSLAFIYPGAGNQFLGMGRDLAAEWPGVMRRFEEENRRLAGQFADGRFWTADTIDAITERDVAFGQVWLGALVTDVLAEVGLRPNAAIGYSLGESAALFATRAWTDRDEMLARMNASPLFTEELAGPCRAARRAWRLPPDEPVDWRLGVVDRTADEVRRALEGRERVYLLIVNTPRECVIGGQEEAVARLVRDLGCTWHPIYGVTTVHCDVARSVADDYRRLHTLPASPPPGVRFYGGVWGAAYKLTRAQAAESIVAQAVGPFDFPRVVNAAYDDGIRVFLEVGPGASCTRMIGQTLGSREHIALSACVAGQSGRALLLRTLAVLAAEGFDVDLRPFYPAEDDASEQMASQAERTMAIAVGTKTIDVPHFAIPSSMPGRPAPVDVEPAPIATSPEYRSSLIAAAAQPLRVVEQIVATHRAQATAQSAFLHVASRALSSASRARQWRARLLSGVSKGASTLQFVEEPPTPLVHRGSELSNNDEPLDNADPIAADDVPPRSLDRAACMEFAIGSIAAVLGPQFAEADSFPTRVRLPDEPLMLVDRILAIEGEPCSLASGRVVTEHDVLPGAWYLDCGRIPTCIAVEAGQADLFLSGYLGIDLRTRGLAVYRLLDAVVTFHAPLPEAGKTIQYDIHIDSFFRQGETHLFRFRFEATVDGVPLLSMRNGCAGFFTAAELNAGVGVVQTALDRRPQAGVRPADWRELVPMAIEAYSDDQLQALRVGDLVGCFGAAFAELPVAPPATIPGGRMTLVDRILRLDPTGGRFGMGQIVGEADIAADAWFLTCHFVDDQVMPGTLMYECCLHTLRVYLLRMGWIGAADRVAFEPVPGVASQLKCRGQVLATTRRVQYEITIKELGYANDGAPFVQADALMYADGKPIVQMNNMSLRMSGVTRGEIEALWDAKAHHGESRSAVAVRPALFDYDRILAFAVGKPSEAFGAHYRVFDADRVIARLPGPPYQFLDRIVSIDGCRPFELAAGGVIEAEYDVPVDAWYFAANRQREMPFAVLLEIALQPCGWLAAYVGSALASDVDLSFRNLGGRAVQHRAVTAASGTLTTRVKMTRVSRSGGMIIQNYDMSVRDEVGDVYVGDTYFGFFSKEALSNQVGIRDVKPYEAPVEINALAATPGPVAYPMAAPFPDERMRMVGAIDHFDPWGGPHGLGFVRGSVDVDPAAWFFKAHFFQDPVWPGSLGLESFLQLLKVAAAHRWGCMSAMTDTADANSAGELNRDVQDVQFETIALGCEHSWVYRGQILPTDRRVVVHAVITSVDDERRILTADGHLWVDGRLIYQMDRFTLRMTASG